MSRASALMTSDSQLTTCQQAFGHLFEPGEVARHALLLRFDPIETAEFVCIVTEAHYYVIKSTASVNRQEVLLFGPLGVESRVERKRWYAVHYLVLEEKRLALKRRAVPGARVIAAAIADGPVVDPSVSPPGLAE